MDRAATPAPSVTIAKPCLNEGGYVEGCLRLASIQVIDNPDRMQAAGLNRFFAEAKGDVGDVGTT